MPSSGVSDGLQSIPMGKWPEAIFLPIENTGNGKVNVYSLVQMMLFKARMKAKSGFEKELAKSGMDEDAFCNKLNKSRWGRHSFCRPAHREAGIATDLVYAVSEAEPQTTNPTPSRSAFL